MKNTTTEIYLNTIEKVKNFVNKVIHFESDIDISIGKYTIDAKSIMGVFSLNLSNKLLVEIHSKNEEEIEKFHELMNEFK